jgi:hypothetical protein
MSERLVLCGGAMSAGGDSPLRLALNGRSQNITLKLEDISKRLVASVPSRLVDLIEIATYVYCADQATSRGGEAQAAMGSDWRRNFRFVIPVRHPDHWSDPKVLGPLCDTISFLSEDNYVFEFEMATNPTELDNYLGLSEDSGTFRADEVVLFSGGLDSLSGAIEKLSGGKTHVALVSHRSSPKIFEHQKQLVQELKRQFPKRLMHVPVLVTGREPLEVREYINASIRLFTDPEHQRARYIVSHGFFKKGEIADICLRHLEIDGEMTTRELAERVMIERKLDATDTTLRKLGCLQGRPSPASCRQTSTGSHGREAQRNVSLGSRRRHYATRRCQ